MRKWSTEQQARDEMRSKRASRTIITHSNPEMEKAILSNYIISVIREYQSAKTQRSGQRTPDLDTIVLPVMRTGVKRKKTNFKKKKSISAKTGVSHNKTIAGRKRAKPALSSRHRRITT